MGLQPKIIKEKSFALKQCTCCHGTFSADDFAPTRSYFYPDGAVPICDECVASLLEEHSWDWGIINKLCQWADVPFSPKEWESMREQAGRRTFHKYAEVFLDSQYDDIGWHDYYENYKKLQEDGGIADEIPGLDEEQRKKYRERWGGAYDDDAYKYLESLYKGLLNTQNVSGALSNDQAVKLCKISYAIDNKIEEGQDFDKLLSSYDKLIKAADFTPKNVKNANDFDSIGEVVKWMEARGWRNGFYDDETRDIVDATIKSMQNFNQRLYTQEVSIGDEISRRIEALKTASQLENDNYYNTDAIEVDADFDQHGYEDLLNEEFEVDTDD